MRSAKHVQNTFGYRSDVWESAEAEAVHALKAKGQSEGLDDLWRVNAPNFVYSL
jgi:hypothetical protein